MPTDKILKFKRGNTTKNNAYTGSDGELTVDRTKKTLVVHDGINAGGSPLATEESVNNVIQELENKVDITAIGLKADTSYVNTQLALKVDDTEIASVNLLRADKYLAAQNIAAMVYASGDLTKIQYNNATDVNYEVFAYTSGNLTSIQHYVASVLKGTTTLNYSSGNLASVIFVGVQ